MISALGHACHPIDAVLDLDTLRVVRKTRNLAKAKAGETAATTVISHPKIAIPLVAPGFAGSMNTPEPILFRATLKVAGMTPILGAEETPGLALETMC